MKIKVTISKSNKVLHVAEREVSQEGDVERAVSEAMTEARTKTAFGEQWGFVIQVDKA
jgi:hypothetical protein